MLAAHQHAVGQSTTSPQIAWPHDGQGDRRNRRIGEIRDFPAQAAEHSGARICRGPAADCPSYLELRLVDRLAS